jgi:RES domain-containing protein
MLSAWRIVPIQRADSAFDGEGARLYGGRWNSPGRATIYTAGSRALAALEALVHLNASMTHMQYRLFEVQFPESLVHTIEIQALHQALRSTTISAQTQSAGDTWLREANSPVLRIFSAIIPQEPNYLLNPQHPKFRRLMIGEAEHFAFDPRLQP